ncbi:MAG: glycosyltransferase family 4 protein [Planctomycetales bacterium]|nr:glycosyltransferase family 4 protein [Planctomycetales bacterium]
MILENESYPEDTRVMLEAEALARFGYDVTVVCPMDESGVRRETIREVRVYRYPKPLELNSAFGYVLEFAYSATIGFLYALYIYFRHGFDAIHIHSPPDMNCVIAIPFQMLGKKFVYDLHDLSPELYQAQKCGRGSKLIERALLFFERLACRQSNRLIATNQTQQQVQIERGLAKAENCYVVRNGPNENFFRTTVPNSTILESGKILIGYVGVIGIQDGVDHFVRAMHVLIHRMHRRDVHGVVVGNGAALNSLKVLAQQLELQDHISFVGKIPFVSVPTYIAAFDVCVTPDPSNSYNDSCTTIKTMEYMALGKPVVCYETTENQKTAGGAALYAVNNDVEDLASKIGKLVDSPELRKKMGDYGRQRIDEGLTWSHQEVQLAALYDSLSLKVSQS